MLTVLGIAAITFIVLALGFKIIWAILNGIVKLIAQILDIFF